MAVWVHLAITLSISCCKSRSGDGASRRPRPSTHCFVTRPSSSCSATADGATGVSGAYDVCCSPCPGSSCALPSLPPRRLASTASVGPTCTARRPLLQDGPLPQSPVVAAGTRESATSTADTKAERREERHRDCTSIHRPRITATVAALSPSHVPRHAAGRGGPLWTGLRRNLDPTRNAREIDFHYSASGGSDVEGESGVGSRAPSQAGVAGHSASRVDALLDVRILPAL